MTLPVNHVRSSRFARVASVGMRAPSTRVANSVAKTQLWRQGLYTWKYDLLNKVLDISTQRAVAERGRRAALLTQASVFFAQGRSNHSRRRSRRRPTIRSVWSYTVSVALIHSLVSAASSYSRRRNAPFGNQLLITNTSVNYC